MKVLTCLSAKEKDAIDSLQHCRVVVSQMPSLDSSEELTAGDEWVHYQELKIKEEDLKLRVDPFWSKLFDSTDASEDRFVVLPKMVKCALSLSHSNADIERSLSIKKRMLIKQIMTMNNETLIGLRATMSGVHQCGGIAKVPINKELLKLTEKSHHYYAFGLFVRKY